MTTASRITDVIVVGAGPAGLAAANALRNTGVQCLVIDAGPPVGKRVRESASTLVSGVGGAGLFSDGKFSFFPSATRLWTLEPTVHLRTAYQWFCELVSAHGIDPDPILNSLTDTDASIGSHQRGAVVRRKRYRSQYMPLDVRRGLIQRLWDACGPQRMAGQVVGQITGSEGPNIAVTLRSNDRARDEVPWRCSALILATGRLGPVRFGALLPGVARRFERIELGVRIEQPAGQFVFKSDPQLDPKLVVSDHAAGWECRTFCCCRQGQIVTGKFAGLTTVSGRADGPTTGYSNVGFNLRIREEALGQRVWAELLPSLRAMETPIQERIDDFVDLDTGRPRPDSAIARCLREPASGLLAQGMGRFANSIRPAALSGAAVHYPAIEGVGYYAIIDASLRIPSAPIWIAGDATGLFRGLTAALVSGYFVGLQTAAFISEGTR